MPIPSDLMVTVAQLSRFNVPSAFLSQFMARPFNIQISTAGVLGVMAFQWQYPGDAAWSYPIVSATGATWPVTVDDTFSDLTFAARTYLITDTYSVDANGAVTGSAGLTTARFDLRTNACSSVTAEAMTLMRDAIRPPLLTWGDDARTHAAQMVYAILKRGRGATPENAGMGDQNVFAAEKIARDFFSGIGENGRPDSMTDTSPSTDGPLLPAYPSGDDLRGW